MSPTQQLLLERIIGSGKWQTLSQLCDLMQKASGTASPALAELVESGAVQAMKPPPGFVRGAQKIFAEAGLEPLDGAMPLSGNRRAGNKTAHRLPEKALGNRAALRAQKKRATARPAVHARPDPAQRIAPTPAGAAAIAPRVALTSSGTLLLMDSGAEISKPHTRALIDFVRALDKAEA